MKQKKFNLKSTKVGQKCKLKLPDTALNSVQFLGIKGDFVLFKDVDKKYIIYGLSFEESLNLVMNY